MTDEKQVKLASKLYEARDAARFVMGDKYRQEIVRWCEAVKICAEKRGKGEIEAATVMASVATKDHDPIIAIMILAAAVELIEPTT